MLRNACSSQELKGRSNESEEIVRVKLETFSMENATNANQRDLFHAQYDTVAIIFARILGRYAGADRYKYHRYNHFYIYFWQTNPSLCRFVASFECAHVHRKKWKTRWNVRVEYCIASLAHSRNTHMNIHINCLTLCKCFVLNRSSRFVTRSMARVKQTFQANGKHCVILTF